MNPMTMMNHWQKLGASLDPEGERMWLMSRIHYAKMLPYMNYPSNLLLLEINTYSK